VVCLASKIFKLVFSVGGIASMGKNVRCDVSAYVGNIRLGSEAI
jgi:hypothetical protein